MIFSGSVAPIEDLRIAFKLLEFLKQQIGLHSDLALIAHENICLKKAVRLLT